jgi:hypothetical protein
MASGSWATTITRFFSPLSKEEMHEKIKKDSATWQEEERNRVARNEAAKATKESVRLAAKWPVGRPKKVRAQAVLVPPNMGAEKQGDVAGQAMQADLRTTVSRSTHRLKSSEEATPTGSFRTCGLILRR